MAGNRKRRISKARLLFGDSEKNANILYASGLFVPDPFPLVLHGRRRLALMSDLEIDRASSVGMLDEVLSLPAYLRRAARGGIPAAVAAVLRERGIDRVDVPADFPLELALALRRRRIAVCVVPDPFFPERRCKSEAEVRKIRDALRAAEAGLEAGIALIRQSRIGRDGYLRQGGRRLTSERVRGEINAAIIRRGCVPSHTIVAGGNQGCDPHESGRGPLRANRPVVIDVFPRSDRTGYWGDITRTVVRGRASDRVRAAHVLVRRGQRLAFAEIRDGADAAAIHRRIQVLFTEGGFPTERYRGRMRGFFHGTGHGVGLEIHEPPRISPNAARLRACDVVTVEPGIYEWGMGGMRLEDMVVVTSDGCRNLTRASCPLEV